MKHNKSKTGSGKRRTGNQNKGNGRKSGSGRSFGSFSFCKISLADLNRKFADHSTFITVSKKFAQACGFENLVSGPSQEMLGSIVSPETPKVQISVTDFDKNQPAIGTMAASVDPQHPVSANVLADAQAQVA